MDMNYYNMNNELLKEVMRGMGEEPTDNMLDNWQKIMDFVPSCPLNNNGGQNCPGSLGMVLVFKPMSGERTYDIECQENTLLKDVFKRLAQVAGFTPEKLNKMSFLCEGQNFNIKSEGTVKSKNLHNRAQVIICDIN